MLIIWGKKLTSKHLGHRPHFCPLCRQITEQAITAVSLVPHIYYIPSGAGTPVRDEARCSGCHTRRIYPPGSTAYSLSSSPAAPPGEGITPSQHDSMVQARAEFETRALAGNITPQERLALLREPILELDSEFHLRIQRGAKESLTALSALGLIVCIFGAAICWSDFLPPRPRGVTTTVPVLWSIGAVVFLVTTVLLITRGARTVARGKLLTMLAKSLLPFKPTIPELDLALGLAKAQHGELATRLSADDIHARMIKLDPMLDVARA